MNSRFKKNVQVLCELLDLFVLNLVFIIAHFVFSDDNAPHFRFYLQFWFIINIGWLIPARLGMAYSKIYNGFESFFRQSIKIYFFWSMGIFFLYTVFPCPLELSRYFIPVTLISY